MARLEPGEKPRWKPGRVAILEGDDSAKVLDHAGSYRLLFDLGWRSRFSCWAVDRQEQRLSGRRR